MTVARTIDRRQRESTPLLAVQGTLALDLEARRDPPFVQPSRHRGKLAAVTTPAPTLDHDDVNAWARRFGQAVVEIVAGDRPTTQLLRWTSQEVYDNLVRRAQLVARAGHHRPGSRRLQAVRPKVVGARSCFVTPDIAEVALHLRYGERSRAIAARFEWNDRRWLCTALEFA